MKYLVKAVEVPRATPRQRRASAPAPGTPKTLPVFSVEAGSDTEARRLVRERFRQQGRIVLSLNATGEDSLIVYVESK